MADQRSIAAVTTSRADWGHLEWPLRLLEEHPGVDLRLIVGGAHVEARFGNTIEAIERAGFTVDRQIPFLAGDDSDRGMGLGIGQAVTGFTQALADLRPDLLLLIADRFEMLAPAAAAMALRIPIAHIEGGEISEGAIDQQVRDALTKMSHLHLVPTDDAAARVIAMGEEPWRVTVAGAPSLDHVRRSELPSREAVETAIGMSLDPAPIVVAFHPVTMHRDTTDEAEAFFAAIVKAPRPIVFCFPNADAGYSRVIELSNAVCNARDDAVLRVNLDHLVYWALLRESALLAGNSSSGIMETASLALPTLNVGIRQQGRTRASNVIDVPAEQSAIAAGLEEALSPSFRPSLQGLVNPYGDGYAAERIVDVLATCPLDDRLRMKTMMEISAESV
ncbi:MAG: UDP-N-acetylglucosamine 2-epimerase [Planctomycetota bacterium]|nr:UDP-N-acetylglucosamine 2-epimerase [Planctomycetota bacterium]